MKAALLIIDMQKYFFRTQERRAHLETLKDHIQELCAFADKAGIMVINITSIHNKDKSTWDIIMKKHNYEVLLRGNDDANLVEGFEFLEKYQNIEKTRHSAFIRTNLEEVLNNNIIDTVIIGGVLTSGCVGRTAIDAYEYDFEVIIAKEASYSPIQDKSEMMLRIIKDDFEQKVLSNKEIFELYHSSLK